MNKKETRGGKRKGSGAKPRYNEPTKTIAFRVPISIIEHVKSVLKTLLERISCTSYRISTSVALAHNEIIK